MVTPWHTRPEEVDDTAIEWVRLSSGVEITRRPLVVWSDYEEDDAERLIHGPIYARLTYRDALAVAAREGARLPSRGEVLEQISMVRDHDPSFVLAPVTLSYGPEMVTREHAVEHDRRVREQLYALAHVRVWSGLIAGIGKHWVGGAAPGRSRICGWPRADGSLIQMGTSDPHDDLHHDYATTTLLVRDRAASTPPSEPPPGPGAPMRPTIRLGSTGAHVGVVQRILALQVDEQFGPRTEHAVKELQRSKGLHDDGVVGAQTWRALGEEPAATPGVGAAPACRAALRDANATWPARSRASDGIMGDARHQAKPSDHNQGNAVDITHDPPSGCDAAFIALAAMRDPRVTYVIWNRKIWSRKRDAEGWRAYVGDNPHTKHVHISVSVVLRHDDGPWPWAAT